MRLQRELQISKSQTETMIKEHVEQISSQLKAAKSKLENYEQLQREVDILRGQVSNLRRENTELKTYSEQSEDNFIELQKSRSRCQALTKEIEFLQQQKNDIVKGRTPEKKDLDRESQEKIMELNSLLQTLNSKVLDYESKLIESENKRVGLRRQLDSLQSETLSK